MKNKIKKIISVILIMTHPKNNAAERIALDDENGAPGIIITSETGKTSLPSRNDLEKKNLERLLESTLKQDLTPEQKHAVLKNIEAQIQELHNKTVGPHHEVTPQEIAVEIMPGEIHDLKVEKYVRDLLNDQTVNVICSPNTYDNSYSIPNKNLIICGRLRIFPHIELFGIWEIIDETSPIYTKLKEQKLLEQAFDSHIAILFHEYGHIKVYRILESNIYKLFKAVRDHECNSGQWSQAEERAADSNVPNRVGFLENSIKYFRHKNKCDEIKKTIIDFYRPSLSTLKEQGAKSYFAQYESHKKINPFKKEIYPSYEKRILYFKDRLSKVNSNDVKEEGLEEKEHIDRQVNEAIIFIKECIKQYEETKKISEKTIENINNLLGNIQTEADIETIREIVDNFKPLYLFSEIATYSNPYCSIEAKAVLNPLFEMIKSKAEKFLGGLHDILNLNGLILNLKKMKSLNLSFDQKKMYYVSQNVGYIRYTKYPNHFFDWADRKDLEEKLIAELKEAFNQLFDQSFIEAYTSMLE